MNSSQDDDALMLRTASGEEAAFRLLVERWEQDIFAFLVRMLGSPAEAEDLRQETFVRVYHRAAAYQPRGMFRSWLFRIAGNLARSRLRRRQILRWVRLDQHVDQVPDERPDALADLERSQTSRRVRAAVAALSDRQREALVLVRFQGLRQAEVAAVMGTTVPGVESLLQRAMRSLKISLSDGG